MRRGRHLSTIFLVECGRRHICVTVRNGRIEDIAHGPAPMRPTQFAIRAAAACWERFWRTVPEPGYHDLLAMTRFGHSRMAGDLKPLMQNLQYIKDVLAAPRGVLGREREEVANGGRV